MTTPWRVALGATALVVLPSATLAQNRSRPIDVRAPGQSAQARIWTETDASGKPIARYRISEDGQAFLNGRETDYDLRLAFQQFDPAVDAPSIPGSLTAGPENRLFIVQYWTQALELYRSEVEAAGGEIHRFLANHANVVELDSEALARVEKLDFVRAVVPFHPAYKLIDEVFAGVMRGEEGNITLNLLTMKRRGHAPVIAWVENNGGVVEHVSAETYLMTVSIQFEQIPELAALNSVQWIDIWGPDEADMNIARDFHGANFVETAGGFTGQGVRAEVRDTGCSTTHQDLPNFILHGNNTSSAHGTSTSGIVLGKGLGNFSARGVMPDAFLVINDSGTPAPGGSRYNAHAETQDPNGPYRCVFQTNSVGGPRTLNYTSTSQNLDLILFDHDRLSVLQSQSNAGNQQSRPEAWAKNIIAVGGIHHRNTLTKGDDVWNGPGVDASIGPAADGRIKPDLASFYDNILTTNAPNSYTSGFGGTSGATPITAGHLGLFYQMWSDGIFGNATPGNTPFENRPFNTTAKAALINTATQWTFSGANHDLTRVHQGWGHADLEIMYENRDNILIVDEADVILPLETKSYFVDVAGGTPEFHATMVYRDLPGTTSASQHRINDLDLLVISPGGDVYKGNNGLLANMFSTTGGRPNDKDTVENVIVENPAAGEWRVVVFAREINQDSHVETAALDADFALVVSTIESVIPACGTARVIGRSAAANPQVYTATPAVVGQPSTFTVDTQGFQFATIIGVKLPENRTLDSGLTALINPESPVVFRIGPFAGPSVNTTHVVTSDPDDCGTTVFTQVKLDNGPGTPFIVTNAQDLIVGN